MALAFDVGEKFAASKAAGQPCRHLVDGGNCGIHQDLGARGYQGCIDFTCQGAGQRLVAEVFADQDWRDTPRLKAPMMEAFRRLREIHELLVLLQAALALQLPPEVSAKTVDLVNDLTPPGPASRDWLADLDLPDQKIRVSTHLKTLAPYVRDLPSLPRRASSANSAGSRSDGSP